jgi:hypothetical protein
MALTIDITRVAEWVTEGIRNEGNERAKEQKSMQATLDSLKATSKKSAWVDLAAHYKKLRGTNLRQLFEEDPKRSERYTLEATGLLLDYSKNLVTDETLELLFRLAAESNLQDHIEAMFRGEKINFTENRAVLHTALRAPRDASVMVGGENVVPKVHTVLDKMAHFSAQVRNGEWRGHTGKQIRNVVNIGIGGSDLGPVMAYEALKPLQRSVDSVPVRFQRGRHRHSSRQLRDLDSGGDSVHGLIENLHHARDHD